jgi:hypothetical protein
VFLTRLNLPLGILNGTPDEQELVPTEEKRFPSVWYSTAVPPRVTEGRKGLTLTLKIIGKILYL